MDDFSAVQTLIGSAGAVVIVGLMQFLKPVWSGLAAPEWETRALPLITLLLSALWQVVVVQVLASLSVHVTFNGWILTYLTVLCALAANGLYSGSKTLAGK